MDNNEIEFLAIGDTVTDAFIRLKDAEAHCDLDNVNCKLCLRFGDKVPFESVKEVRAVGNCANAAVAASRLGIKSALLTHLGDDQNGKNCIEELKKNNVNTKYVYSHTGMPTNYHYVLWYEVERTILVNHTNYPVSMPDISPAPKMIYLTSLGDHTQEYHQQIANYVKSHPEIKLVFQPGTFQIKLGTQVLAEIYKNTYIFFCNLEEAKRILKTEQKEITALLRALHALGPKLVCITDGINGAYASDGKEAWYMPVYPHDPYERTGAGDAFASTVSIALLKGKTLPEALVWGPINSMSVVQYIGAQEGLLSEEKLLKYIKEAPVNYQIRSLM